MKRVLLFATPAAATLVNKETCRIPTGDPDWQVRGQLTFLRDAELVWIMPHMHLCAGRK